MPNNFRIGRRLQSCIIGVYLGCGHEVSQGQKDRHLLCGDGGAAPAIYTLLFLAKEYLLGSCVYESSWKPSIDHDDQVLGFFLFVCFSEAQYSPMGRGLVSGSAVP